VGEAPKEAAVIDGKTDITLRIRDSHFTLQKDYSQLSCIAFAECQNTHQIIYEEIAKNSLYSPHKYEVLTVHLENITAYLAAAKNMNPACKKRINIELRINQITEGYENIRKPIVNEIDQWS
jgi:hypothetical protein